VTAAVTGALPKATPATLLTVEVKGGGPATRQSVGSALGEAHNSLAFVSWMGLTGIWTLAAARWSDTEPT